MTSKQYTNWIYKGVFYVAAGLTYAAILLRTYLLYRSTPVLRQGLALLLLFLLLSLLEMFRSKRLGRLFHVYLALQTIVVCILLFGPDFIEYDYFSLLFAIMGMQLMENLNYRSGIAWIVFFLIIIGVLFIFFEGPLSGLIKVLMFGAVIIFLSAYALESRRAQEARSRNQSLIQQLEEANLQLQVYSDTLEKLSVARERQRLARELHDSVTQTIFSMTLTTQSAMLLLQRDPNRLGDQLERLNQLAQSALMEMHTLISELRPNQTVEYGLVMALRQHLNNRQLPEGLTVSMDVEGEQALSPSEDQGLFRIAQEAVNNVIKHANASHVKVRLHLVEPYWIEIEDDGQGFVTQQALGGGRLGLESMRERAVEIGWDTQIYSSPGQGTHIRVEKKVMNIERALWNG